jgi:RNA polymerase sigma-70 factor (ECF subfamily)
VSESKRDRFHAIYSAHREALLAYLLRRTDDPADAADVLAEVFLVAWRRADAVPVGDAARAWLFGVARRALANHRRSERRRSALASELAAALASVPPPADDAFDPDLRGALESLEARDREIVALTAWEQLTPAEIAQVLDMNPVTVRVRLHRARRRLEQKLIGDPPEPAPATAPAQ